VPVPLLIGAPSTIKHVFLIVRGDRTLRPAVRRHASGNGDPAFTQFGETVTPNQHALARQFGLYDNFYDAGTNSAEGHNWLMQADNPEYTQSLAGQYVRATTPRTTLRPPGERLHLDGAEAAGKAVRDFGEFQQFLTKPAGATWQNLYCDAKNMQATGASTAYPLVSTSPIPSLNNVSVPGFRSSTPAFLTSTGPDLETGLPEERPGEPEHVLALQRPHRRPAEPCRPGRRQRPRHRPDRRHDLAQQVLEGLGDLRGRGRLPGRL